MATVGNGVYVFQLLYPLAFLPFLAPEVLVLALPAEAIRETNGLLGQIPAGALVSASAGLLPHLGHRRRVYAFPNPFQSVASGPGARALRQMEYRDYSPQSWTVLQASLATSPVEYVALAPSTSTFTVAPDKYPAFVVALLHSPANGIVSLGQKAMILRRGRTTLGGCGNSRRGAASPSPRAQGLTVGPKSAGLWAVP